ncbi:non-ribosomal peptide synthetase [Agrobacterium vitis]|nr:non-ribosomal peptide synthetase [Agrobacterium vitis]
MTNLGRNQRRLWVLEEMQDLGAAYNLPCAVLVEGTLDFETLSRCVRLLFDRHEALRTIFFDEQGMPGQRIVDVPEVALELEEVSGSTLDERLSAARLRLNQWCSQPFDLRSEIPFRVGLFRLDETSHILTMVMHHIVSDAWSINVLLRDLWTSYAAFAAREEPALPPLTMCYSDFAEWQRSSATEDAIEKQVQYWKEALGDAPTGLELPTDQVRPAVQSYRGAVHRFTFPAELIARVNRLAREENVTTFMYFLTVFSIVLSRWSGQEDVVIGSPTAGRVRREFEDLVGFFVNMLPLRLRPSSNQSFRELLANTRKIALEAYANQDVPFDVLVDAMQPARDFSRHPVFQATFALQSIADDIVALPNLTLQPFDLHTGAAKFDIAFTMTTTSADASGEIEYAADLFSPNAIELLAGHLLTLTERLTERHDDPIHQISMLGEQENAARADRELPWSLDSRLLFDRAEVETDLISRFDAQVARFPAALAIADDEVSLTYRELQSGTKRIATELAGRMQCGRIALLFKHGALMTAAMLGVLRAGGSYVPLDPNHPMDRLRFIIAETQPDRLLTDIQCVEIATELLPNHVDVIDDGNIVVKAQTQEHVQRDPASIAYILYTSGTTGAPNGVIQNDGNVLHFISAYTNALKLTSNDRLSLFPPYTFDASVMDVYGALLNGASLYVRDLRIGVLGIDTWLQENEISVWHSTPTVFRQVVGNFAGLAPRCIRLVVLGGEEVLPSDLSLFNEKFTKECILVNGFGPTESTVTTQYFFPNGKTVPTGRVPIGNPTDLTEIILLDSSGNPGELQGEIAICSDHIALGYFNKPHLNDARFLSSKGRRIYRTGDFGRWRVDGKLEFLGRRDHQVKVRGFRVELGEIEANLLALPEVEQAVVLAIVGVGGDKELVAYIVGRASTANLSSQLQKALPDYMLPTAYVLLESLPITPNGKVDRRALPPPPKRSFDNRYVEPPTTFEQEVAKIWAEVLGVPRIGYDADFFQSGGHSLKAMQVVARIHNAFGIALPLLTIFSNPVLRHFCAAILEVDSTVSTDLDEARRKVLSMSDVEVRALLQQMRTS